MNLFFNRDKYLNILNEEKEYRKELEDLIGFNKKQIKDEIKSDNKDENLINYLEAENKDYQVTLDAVNKKIEEIESAFELIYHTSYDFKNELMNNGFVQQSSSDVMLREQIACFPLQDGVTLGGTESSIARQSVETYSMLCRA
ncbi:TPA: hypothetical protein ACGEYH_001711 [Providencia rettgeri]